MVDMGQADSSLRQKSGSVDECVFQRHRERMRTMKGTKMARMSELMIDTEIMLRDGFTVDQIVEKLGIPAQWVLTIRDMMDMEE